MQLPYLKTVFFDLQLNRTPAAYPALYVISNENIELGQQKGTKKEKNWAVAEYMGIDPLQCQKWYQALNIFMSISIEFEILES